MDEVNALKRQSERDKAFLESELRELQQQVLKINETKENSTTDYTSKIRDLELKVSKLEMERDHLLVSIEGVKQRHKDEMTSLETSHKFVVFCYTVDSL